MYSPPIGDYVADRCFFIMTINISNIEDLNNVALTILKQYPNERIFALHGAMGVGKTTFMQAMAQILGSTSSVSSPTFALVNEYELANGCIYHFDFYRIKNSREAQDIGFEEYLYSGEYCFIEWAEMVEELLPEETIHINIHVDNDNLTRIFQF